MLNFAEVGRDLSVVSICFKKLPFYNRIYCPKEPILSSTGLEQAVCEKNVLIRPCPIEPVNVGESNLLWREVVKDGSDLRFEDNLSNSRTEQTSASLF